LSDLIKELALNNFASVKVITIGNEKTPLLVIDNFANNAQAFITQASNGEEFSQQASDFYPGIRKQMPASYGTQLSNLYHSIVCSNFSIKQTAQAKTILSAFSITTTPPNKLKPIQMVPHFDSTANKQYAVIHYLCDKAHGGTSFYRHKSTGFERITEQKISQYGQVLKQQALAENLHLKAQYIEGDTPLFERIFSVEAKMNRAIIFPSNMLHSGNIKPEAGLISCPKKGRLTVSSFIVIE